MDSFFDKLNKESVLNHINRVVISKPISSSTDTVISIRSLFEYPLDISYNVVQVDTNTGTEHIYKRNIFNSTDDDNTKVCNFMSSIKGKEMVFGLSSNDKNMETYNSSKLIKYRVDIVKIEQIDEFICNMCSVDTIEHRNVVLANDIEYKYVEYMFPIQVLGTRTITANSKSGEKHFMATEFENYIFVRDYISCNKNETRYFTVGMSVNLIESSKINSKRIEIISSIMQKLMVLTENH